MSVDRVLFDAPGPRARRRTQLVTVLSLVVIAAVVALALHQFASNGQLAEDRWSPFTHWPYIHFLLQGLRGTVVAAALGAVVAFPLGAVFALLRLSQHRVLRWPATAYIELFRAVPLLLLVYAFLLALPPYGVNLSTLWKLVVPIIIVNTAVLAEIFRAGVNALDRGQSEAAAAIGLSYGQSMRLVVLPQAVRLVVPALVTQLVALLKDSTLGYVVSYEELMKQANNLTVYTHLLVQTFLIVSVVYVLINATISFLARQVERRTARRVPGRPALPSAAAEGAPETARLAMH